MSPDVESLTTLADMLRAEAAELRQVEHRRDLHKDADRLDHVADWLGDRTDLPMAQIDWPCVLCEAEPGDLCFEERPASFHHQRGFSYRSYDDIEPEATPANACTPVVESGPGGTFRARCLGCGERSNPVPSENWAAELSNDHAFPGWRALPNVPDLPDIQGGTSKAEIKAMARWREIADSILPPGWIERGGPIKTMRTDSRGTRHVPGGSPGGGYKMSGGIPDDSFILAALEGHHLADFLPGADHVKAKKRVRDSPGSWGRADAQGIKRMDRDPITWDRIFQIIATGSTEGRRERYEAAFERWGEWVAADRAMPAKVDPDVRDAHRRHHVEVTNELRNCTRAVVRAGVARTPVVEVGDNFSLF